MKFAWNGRWRSAVLLAIAALLGGPRRASAQVNSPLEGDAPKRAVTPPELLKFIQADYPAEAQRLALEGDVVLSLDIDDQGTVTDASVTEGAGHGFDEVAKAAALQFQFRPAERSGRAVRSRILYRYSFHFQPPPIEHEPAPLSVLGGAIVIAGSHTPIAGAKVSLSSAAHPSELVMSGEDGRFRLGDLAPGSYHVAVEAAGFQPFSVDEVVAESQELSASYGLVPSAEPGVTITVQAERPVRELTRRSISRQELARIPGTSGDALRALQNLPGVARAPALSGVLVVRGNADGTTPVFVDGIWLPTVYHFGGLSSVVPTEMLDEINFYPGNFSVRYGRALAGVVDAHLRETRADGRYHGLAQVDLIDVRGMLEGPVPGLAGWNFIAGVRRSHLDAWLAPLLKNRDTDIVAAPVYYDYQLFLDHHPTATSYLRLGVLGFDDRFTALNQASAAGGQLDAINASWGLGAIYDNQPSDTVRFHATVSLARDHERAIVSTTAIDTVALASITRAELEWKMWPKVTFRTGFDGLVAPYTAKGQLPQSAGAGAPSEESAVVSPSRVFDRKATYFVPALYAEMDMHPSRRTQITTGVRADFTWETQRVDVAPRMTARYKLFDHPGTTLKAGSGLFFQPPGFVELALKEENNQLRSPRAFQNSLGVEQMLGKQVTLSVEGFFNLLDNLVSESAAPDGALRYNNYAKGRIFGSEVMLRYQADEHFFGWLSYTLSRSERTWVPGQPSQLFSLDQTHILTALGSYKLGRGWEAGFRFRYVTGNLYTPCSASIFSSTSTSFLCIAGPQLSQRVPAFHQLDLRIDKRWKISRDVTLSAYLDLINAYNHKNPDFIQYSYDFSSSRAQTASLPIIPSLGLRGEF
jgi:TonB family protein